ncbi:hypothetical protein llap_4217 [Limosa lapponica baueri]|uniref:Uncharacterized protein n=1 Tax=Limosa lapponica baueri TaxID=1758121 RepID=A0A2I0UHC9_LIMLA|nr:hypothetical protein llap_4217 [Limosa lapponica baueri]
MDVGILWAVGTMLKSQDANSHPYHRKVGPISEGDPGSCRKLSAWAGGQPVGMRGNPVWCQICPAGPEAGLALMFGKAPGQSTEHTTSKKPDPPRGATGPISPDFVVASSMASLQCRLLCLSAGTSWERAPALLTVC